MSLIVVFYILLISIVVCDISYILFVMVLICHTHDIIYKLTLYIDYLIRVNVIYIGYFVYIDTLIHISICVDICWLFRLFCLHWYNTYRYTSVGYFVRVGTIINLYWCTWVILFIFVQHILIYCLYVLVILFFFPDETILNITLNLLHRDITNLCWMDKRFNNIIVMIIILET